MELNEDEYWSKVERAGNASTPPDELRILMDTGVVGILEAIGQNPATPPDILEELSAYPVFDLWTILLDNSNTPINALDQMCLNRLDDDNETMSIHLKLASHPKTSPESLDTLYANREIWNDDWYTNRVKDDLALNPNTPSNLLISLAKDESKLVRKLVAMNPSTPVGTLHVLANDPSYEVRASLARNLQAPLPIIELLSKDKSFSVQGAVASNPKTPTEVLVALASVNNKAISAGLASNPKATQESLVELSQHSDESVRSAVASNENVSLDLLRALARDLSKEVRQSVASNPLASEEILRVLHQDKSESVSHSAWRNLQRFRQEVESILSLEPENRLQAANFLLDEGRVKESVEILHSLESEDNCDAARRILNSVFINPATDDEICLSILSRLQSYIGLSTYNSTGEELSLASSRVATLINRTKQIKVSELLDIGDFWATQGEVIIGDPSWWPRTSTHTNPNLLKGEIERCLESGSGQLSGGLGFVSKTSIMPGNVSILVSPKGVVTKSEEDQARRYNVEGQDLYFFIQRVVLDFSGQFISRKTIDMSLMQPCGLVATNSHELFIGDPCHLDYFLSMGEEKLSSEIREVLGGGRGAGTLHDKAFVLEVPDGLGLVYRNIDTDFPEILVIDFIFNKVKWE